MGGKLTCADISVSAIKHCKINLANNEAIFLVTDKPQEISDTFNGIIVWNVIHHIVIQEQMPLIECIYNKLSNNGVLLISGFSNNDSEFKNGAERISPTTNSITTSLKNDFFDNTNLSKAIIDSGEIKLKEGNCNKLRTIRYFFLIKREGNSL